MQVLRPKKRSSGCRRLQVAATALQRLAGHKIIFTTIDFDRKERQHGFLQLPVYYNLAGWANIMISITFVNGRPGPTALILAGTHGDGYPGQIAVSRLAHRLEVEKVPAAPDAHSHNQSAGEPRLHAAFSRGRQEPEPHFPGIAGRESD